MTTTATVTITALTVDGQHLTPTMWEQVPERALITHDGTLDGHPWGTVNLHTECGDPNGHLHVVYTHHGTLYQATVPTTSDYPHAHSEPGAQLFNAELLTHLQGDDPTHLAGSIHTEAGVTYEFGTTPAAQRALGAYTGLRKEHGKLDKIRSDQDRYGGATKRLTKQQDKVDRAEETFNAALDALDTELGPLDTDALYDQFTRQARAEADRRNTVAHTIETLAALPQLYILGGAP